MMGIQISKKKKIILIFILIFYPLFILSFIFRNDLKTYYNKFINTDSVNSQTESDIESNTEYENTIDLVSPIITIYSPANKTKVSNESISVTFSSNEDGYYYYQGWNVLAANKEVSFLNNLKTGDNEISIRVKDLNNNE